MNSMLFPTSRNRRVAIMATACLVAPLTAGDLPGGGPVAQRALDQRRIDMQEAEELLLQGDQAYQTGRLGEAAAAFAGARSLLRDAPASRELRAAATERYVLASVERARELSRKGDVAAATATIDAVLAPGVAPNHPEALAMRAQLADPIRTNPAATTQHAANVDEVRRLLYTAEGAYNLGRFDDAKRHYESVLRIDPANTAARRGMEQVALAVASYSRAATDHTRAEMLAQVDAAWETPVTPILDAAMIPGLTEDIQGAAMPVRNKLDRIILPEIMLEDATIDEAVDLLRQRALELDTFEPDPARRGINFTVEIGGNESPLGTSIRAERIKLRARNLPMSAVLDQVTSQTKTSWTTDAFAVIVRPQGAEAGQMQTRVFRVPPNFKNALHSQAGAGADAAADDPFAPQQAAGLQVVRLDVKEALSKLGVQFPAGASVSLVGNSLAVTNTPSNIAFVEAVVDSVAKSERVMVKVVVKMIRIQENRLKELGVDWLLDPQGFGGASWIPGADKLNISGGTRGNGGNLGDMTVPSGSDAAPITAGNRSGNEAAFTDSIDAAINRPRYGIGSLTGALRSPGAFQVIKVLDDGVATAMLRGLNQKKNLDIMTSAATVVHSSQASSVRSVKEMMYPQSYEPPELPNSVGGDFDGGFGGFGGGNPTAVTPSHPTDFTTREIGVILDVTPTADPDNGCVDVSLVPQVVNFDGFIDWGSPIRQPVDVPLTGLVNPLASATSEVSANHIYMPVFSRYSTNTSVYVADGSTIVVGGMLQDRINTIQDRTPVLGAVPLVGRLFQSNVNQPVSTAVVFFVSVNLVDPTGQPLKQR